MNETAEMRVVAQNVASLYAAPVSGAELVSQAILGDRVAIEGEQDGFCRVTTADTYSGWIAARVLLPLQEDLDALTTTVATLLADVYSAPDPQAELLTKLTVGASVVLARRAGVGDWIPLDLPDGQMGYVRRVSLSLTHAPETNAARERMQAVPDKSVLVAALGRNIAETAKRFIGTPYLWGGCTPFGIDCSGLTQLCYKLNGVQLLRDAAPQFADRRFGRVEDGLPLAVALLEDGDLVAFSRREDRQPTHIGIALGDGRFLHARGGLGVRIDDCDSEEYGKTYVGTIRLSPDAEFAVEAA